MSNQKSKPNFKIVDHRKQSFQYLKRGILSLWVTPWKCILPILWILFCMFLWAEKDILFPVDEYNIFAPLVKPLIPYILNFYFATFFLIIIGLLGYPWGRQRLEEDFHRIGLVNAIQEAPLLLRIKRDPQDKRVKIYSLHPAGLAEEDFLDKKNRIETILNRFVVKTKWEKGRKIFCLYTVPAISELPSYIHWKGNTSKNDSDFTLILGEGYMGPVTVDLTVIPHILLGGSTGSGKTVLLKMLLMQAMEKGATVYIADFKGGVDFNVSWCKDLNIITTLPALNELLSNLSQTLDIRMSLFQKAKCNSLDKLNALYQTEHKRIIFACDEIAEVLDKTGRQKDDLLLIEKIEAKLSRLARLGRGFGIHLIIATQRPDHKLLDGQFRDNFDCRICGRSTWNLSKVILGNTMAAEEVPKDAAGRFVMHDGTVFQSYMLPEESAPDVSQGAVPLDYPEDLIPQIDFPLEDATFSDGRIKSK